MSLVICLWALQRHGELLSVGEVEAVRAIGLSVFTSEHTELRESARALSVCLGCHIQLSVNQSSIA